MHLINNQQFQNIDNKKGKSHWESGRRGGRLLHVRNKATRERKGERILTSELIALFEELAGKTIEKQWGAFSLPDRKILEPWSGPVLPGWEPHIGIRQGVKEMIQLVNS